MAEKPFEKIIIQEENWNNRGTKPIETKEPDPGQSLSKMGTFIRLADTFIYQQTNGLDPYYKGQYRGKALARLGVGKEELSVEVVGYDNYAYFHYEPSPADDNGNILGMYAKGQDTVFRYFELTDPEAPLIPLRKFTINTDGFYQVYHKEQFNLPDDTIGLIAYVERVRKDPDGGSDIVIPIAVSHYTGVYKTSENKTFTTTTVSDGGEWASAHSHQVTVTYPVLSFGMAFQIWTSSSMVYSELLKGDTLEIKYKIFQREVKNNHAADTFPPPEDLEDPGRKDATEYLRPENNVFFLQFLLDSFDRLPNNLKKHYPLPTT